jgi:sporulation protein YlmC with PRC-barrel domain
MFLAGCLAMGSFTGGLYAAEDPATDTKNPALHNDRAASMQLLRAKELIGKSVKNEEGKDIGTIQDIVVDSKQGRIAYAVLQFGGFLGFGEKQFAIPFGAFQEDATRKNLILNVKKEKLEAARGFEKDKWPDMADETWARDLHKHYGYDAYWESRQGGNPKVEEKPGTPGTPGSDAKQTSRPEFNREHFWVNRVSEILGKHVKNSADEDLGKVSDIMIDMKHGRIVYAVLTDGGTLGIDETLTAVPFAALQCQPEKKQFTLNSSKEALKPYSFKESAWPNMSDSHWARKVHEGFKQEPYWSVYGFAGDDLDANWRQGSEYNKAFDASKSRTITGKVTSIAEYSPAKDSAKGRMIVVTNDAGETFTVHLGPVSYLDRKNGALMLKEGDTVTINASTGRFEGREAFQARDIRVGSGETYPLRDTQGRAKWDGRDDKSPSSSDPSRPDQNPKTPDQTPKTTPKP